MLRGTISAPVGDKFPTDFAPVYRSWMRSLKAERKSPATTRAYGYALIALVEFLQREGMPTDPVHITAEHLREFLTDQAIRNSPSTARLRRTYLSVFFGWLVEEGEIKVNPVARIKAVAVQDRPPDMLSDADWEALIATCRGNHWEQRRDAAILRVLESSGLRRSECASLLIGDVELDESPHVRVVGKGDRVRVTALDGQAVSAIDRYLTARAKAGKGDERNKDAPLWIARSGGPLTHIGIAAMVRRRGEQAGLTVHAHQLRHRWAHHLKSKGMSDENLMSLGGWKNRDIMERYGRAATADRALEAYRRIRE